jgi:hypothetical protein
LLSLLGLHAIENLLVDIKAVWAIFVSVPSLDRNSINATAKQRTCEQMEHAADSRQKHNLMKVNLRFYLPVTALLFAAEKNFGSST